jgi:subfamily B ATP-binding cassette protein MsbA
LTKLFKIFVGVITGHPLHSLFFFIGITIVGVTQIVSIGSLYPIAQYLMDPNGQPNTVIRQFNRLLTIFGYTSNLLNYLLLFLIISFISALVYVLLETYQAFFLRNLEYNERYSLTQQVVFSQWESLRNLNHGDFINAVTHEAEGYKGVVKYCFIVISELVQISFFLYFAFLIEHKIVTVTLVLFLSSAVVFYPFMKRSNYLSHLWTNAYSHLTDGLVNIVRSFKSTKASSMERFVMKYLDGRIFSVCHEYFKQQVLAAVQGKLSELTGYIVLTIIIYAGVMAMAIPFPDILLVLVIFVRVVPKTKLAIDSFLRAYSGLPSIDRMESIKKASRQHNTEGKPLAGELHSISMRSVVIRYGDESPLFRGLNLDLQKGDFWGICGPTGTGKTTLLDILAGIVKPSEGTIHYNAIPSGEIQIESLHKHIGYITQDNFIFAGSIIENICWGNDHPNMPRLKQVIKAAQLEEMLHEKGCDFSISESGQNLSGGQRQRISIARILMHDLDFILMDEPTSALDQETEYNFISALMEFKGKVGVVMVTHRQQNIKYFDNVLMLCGGSAYEIIKMSDSDTNKLVAQ